MSDVNIYKCRDGRTRVYLKDTKKVISYPRFLMEEKLGRKLNKNEQVHHIDEDPFNNDFSNLEIVNIGEHQRMHNQPKYYDKNANCAWCGKEFIWTAKQQRTHFSNFSRKEQRDKIYSGPCCSKNCYGSLARAMQLKR